MVDAQASLRGAAQDGIRTRLVDIARLLLSGVDLQDVLHNVARAACEVAGYDRCVVVTAAGDVLTGQAGHGVASEDVTAIQVPLDSVPELARLLPGREPLVMSPDITRSVIPERYVRMFRLSGTLIVLPLSSSTCELRGLVFVDRLGSRFTPGQRELQALVDFADIAALVVQNTMLAADSQRLAALLERSRMASELHDGVTQLLFAIDLGLQESLTVPRLPAAARTHLERARADVATCSRQLRAALYELTQEGDEEVALSATPEAGDVDGDPWLAQVDAVVDSFFHRSGISVDVQVRGEGLPPAPHGLDVLLRTVREGLANVLKHAEATEVLVVVRRSQHWWMVEVHDDGDADPTRLRRTLTASNLRPGADRGYGLISLKHQTAQVGGRLWLSESPKLRGLQVTTSVPTEALG